MTITTQLKINRQVKAPYVRLIDENSIQIGSYILMDDALQIAQEKGLDLVEISPQAEPPVCKLMNYSKYLFEEKKKEKEQKRAQRVAQVDVKEIQINPVIQDGDLKIKIKNINRILDEGNKVRVVVKFSGRQLRHVELGKQLFEKVIAALPDVMLERQPIFEGKNLFIVISKNFAK